MIKTHAGQVLVAGFGAGEPPTTLLRRAQQGQLAGFILFRRNVTGLPELAELNRGLLAAFPTSAPPFLAVDQEGGRVARIPAPLLQLPAMRELAAHDDLSLTQGVARVLSGQLRALGFNLNMAPVLDVDTQPANPIIGDRSFGGTVEQVIAHGRAVLAGMSEAGLAGCGKHFPGHGDTELDSHLALPYVKSTAERLHAVELAPFRALMGQLPALLTAHVVYEALDPEQPATLSPAILTELLRKRLGFSGVLFSDDMDMKAISADRGPGAAACAAIAAGCDTLLLCAHLDALESAYEALVKRAETDQAFAARLREAAERSLAMRVRYRPEVTVQGDPGQRFAAESEPWRARLGYA